MIDPQARLSLPEHGDVHVPGYTEQGNINTPLELAILNQVDRFKV
jgi:xylulose-5-phosphate/fructose-6-phosphate phosphoketolase